MRALFAMLLLGPASAFAQPTITAASLPQPGFVDTMPRIYPVVPLSPGAAGANVVWDFSGLPAAPGYPDTVAHTACPGGPGCAGFPGASLVSAIRGRDSLYFNVTGGGQSLVGSASDGGVTLYANPMDFVRVPVTYSSTFTDSFAAFYTSAPATVPRYQSGTATVAADGWGTLKIPAGTFSPVLRLKRTIFTHDSLVGFPGTGSSSQAVIYQWYSPAVRGYLLEIAPALSGTAVSYRSGIPAVNGVADPQAGEALFTVLPNPATGLLSIRWSGASAAEAMLTDFTGRALLQTTGRGTASMNVEDLPRGMYVLRIRNETGAVHSQKVTLR